MSTPPSSPDPGGPADGLPADGLPADGLPADGLPADGLPADDLLGALRDIGEVPAVELVSTAALHLMSAAAVKCGLGEDLPGASAEQQRDLAEARVLIQALAGLVTAAAPDLGSHHAAPLRDGLKSLQLAFREASAVPDPPGKGPGEAFTGPVWG